MHVVPNKIIAATGAITAAMHAERILRAAGVSAEVVALDPDKTRRGCAFGVAFSSSDEAAARRAFRAARVFVSQYLSG